MSRNAQGNGSIRKRSNGTWEARYTVGRDMKTGKQIQKSVYGKTQQEVRKKLSQITNDIDNGVFTEPSKITVAEWLDIFLAEYNGNVKESTQKSYEIYCTNHLKPLLGQIKLNALTTPMIQKAYNDILAGETSSSPIKAKTLKNCHGVLHKALNIAQKVGYIRYNPSDSVILPRAERPVIKPLSDEDIARFINEIQGHKYEDLFIVTLFTGMRQGEILGLTWDCVDLDKHTITINKQLIKEKEKNGKYKFASLKNDKCRTEQVPETICAILSKLRKQPNANNEMNLVFVDENGEHLVHQTVLKNYKAVAKKIGIPSSRFHDLRHTFAVLSLQNGDSIKTVQENLGHATASFTMQTYAHVSDRMKKESADRMEAYIAGIGKLLLAKEL